MCELLCGDCANHRIKRDKKGKITGEHICPPWNMYKSEWSKVGDCSFFIDKAQLAKAKGERGNEVQKGTGQETKDD